MADGKLKATLMPRGIFRWQRFPLVPVRHSPWSHLPWPAFPDLGGKVGGRDELEEGSVPNTGGSGWVVGLGSFTPEVPLPI